MTPRDLPSVSDVLLRLGPETTQIPHALLTSRIRIALTRARQDLLRGETPAEPIENIVRKDLAALLHHSLVHVVNATGVILHTNLGRAPLTRYANLEYDLATGKRGNRDVHTAALLEAILGKPAVVVNNAAAALFLILNELAAGGEAIVSRGELIEIGDGFRIPEIIRRSGAILREVGATNRTHIGDYRDAINDHTRVLLRVHPSNFTMTGFTGRPELSELAALGRERGIPVYEDLGSGCVTDLSAYGIDEPLAQKSLAIGANLISFSGDKLLGGPQAGIIAGDAELVARVRRNPLFRALRQDKLFYDFMGPTLRHILLEDFDAIPALRMIRTTAEALHARSSALINRLKQGTLEKGESIIGGGSTPDLRLPTWLIALDTDERILRANTPPIIARTERGRVLLDLRTVFPDEEDAIVQALS